MNSKIQSIIIPSSILAFTLITAGIPTLFETVLAQNDELGEQQQTNDTGLSQGQASEGSSTDTSNTDTSNKISNTDTSNTDTSNTDTSNTDTSNTDTSNTDTSNTDTSNTDSGTQMGYYR